MQDSLAQPPKIGHTTYPRDDGYPVIVSGPYPFPDDERPWRVYLSNGDVFQDGDIPTLLRECVFFDEADAFACGFVEGCRYQAGRS